METKFKIGEDIYFMYITKPTKSKVTGIGVYWGVDKNVNKREVPMGEYEVVYFCNDTYSEVKEKDCFKTKEELINNVFGSLE